MTMLSMETSLIRDGRGAMLLSYAGQLNTTTLLKGELQALLKALELASSLYIDSIISEESTINYSEFSTGQHLIIMGSDGCLETRHFPTQKGFFGRPENHNGTCSLLSWVLPSFSIFNSKLPSNIQCLCT